MSRWKRGRKDDKDGGGYVLLASFPEVWQADLFVSLLASEGIRAWSADERFINGTDHATDMGRTGVIVGEADAISGWNILQMAERGELSLPEEVPGFTVEWNRRERENGEPASRRSELDTPDRNLEKRNAGSGTRYPQLPTHNLSSVRCPRCGSENSERKKGIGALFSPGYRCRVCKWTWKGNT